MLDSPFHRLDFQLRALWALTSEHKNRTFEPGFGECLQQVHRALPRLQLCAKQNDRLPGRDTQTGAGRLAVREGGLGLPPIIVNGIGSEGNFCGGNTKTLDHFECAGGRDNHLVGLAKKKRPKRFLERNFPGFAVARSQAVRVGTEQEGSTRSLCRAASNPEGCSKVADKTQYGFKFSVASQLGQPW